jgi:LysM repeat protein
VISELLAILSGQRVRIHLPGLDVPQRFAAGLLISVVTMISVPLSVQADAPPDRQIVATASPAAPSELIMEPVEAQPPEPAAAPQTARVDHAGHQHVVRAGDDLWSLAERYYGDGRDWRKIAAANPKVLTGGPDRLQVGWRLKIPDLDEGISEAGGLFEMAARHHQVPMATAIVGQSFGGKRSSTSTEPN